jgi:heparan-alpha-glucosaminide N-acetyltransferase
MEVPGCGRGYIGPGGRADNGSQWKCTGGAAGYLDQIILSTNHIYPHPTCKSTYDTGSFDPEGILGTLNTIVICFLGVQAGRILVYHQRHISRLLRFVMWGVIFGAGGTILCEASQNDGIIPLNKNLWSLSFILVTAGTGYILLAICYLFVDVFHIWDGGPFVYPGMNSIMVYVGSELLEGIFPFGWNGMKSSHGVFLTSNIISVSLWCLIAYYWYTIKFFVKI